MPKMPPRPCTHHRCKGMAIKAGRCKDHQVVRAWASSDGKTSSQRGYGAPWRKLRAKALTRDKYLCQNCLKSSRATKATDVDHIVSKAKGGTDDLDNLQSLCNPCHKAKTILERKE